MMAKAFLTWKGLGAGGGRTSLDAADSSLLPPSPHIERGAHCQGHLPPLSAWGGMLLVKRGGQC